jgi:YegS/Rv2252/BmrU family lipid kinase
MLIDNSPSGSADLKDEKIIATQINETLMKDNTPEYKSHSEATVLIVNPNSCSGLTGKNWDILYKSIKQVFGTTELKVVFSKKPGDGTIIARDHLKRGFKNIVAIGGDGTINEIANGFFEDSMGIKYDANDYDANDSESKPNAKTGDNRFHFDSDKNVLPSLTPIKSDAIFAVVPCGTRNVLVRSLGLPSGIVDCCRNFVEGKIHKIDVIAALATNADGSSTKPRVFLNAAEIGVGAEIITRSRNIRKKINNRLFSTITGIVRTMPVYESNLCEISVDNGRENIITKVTMGIVANGKYLGGGFKAAPHADISDGLLDVVILKNSDSLTMLDDFISMKAGDYSKEANIFYLQAKRVTIKSKEKDVPVTIDGEPIGVLPAIFEVYHSALTVKL